MRELDTSELSRHDHRRPGVSAWSRSGSARRSSSPPTARTSTARSPARRDGTYTDGLARDIFEQLIEPADVLLDLHGGDLVEALEPFALYGDEASRELALAFGLPLRDAARAIRWRGMTATAAAQAGTRAVLAEAGGIGQLEEHAVTLLAEGVTNALQAAGHASRRAAAAAQSRSVGDFIWLRCAAGRLLGGRGQAGRRGRARAPARRRSRDLYGDTLEEIRAPAPACRCSSPRAPRCGDDGLLLGLGADLSRRAASGAARARARRARAARGAARP